jgi:TRAP-type mannitol/chloroaromatic compound transport system substrate-binding protein
MTADAGTNAPLAPSRRGLIKAAATATGAAAIAFPAVIRAQAPVKWRVQTAAYPKTAGYPAFQRYCASVKVLSEGKLEFQPLPAGAIVGSFEMFDAVKGGQLDAMHCFSNYWAGNMPVTAFLSSYPLGLDRRTSGRRGSTSSGDCRSRGRRTKPTTCSMWDRSSTTST